MKGQRNHSFRCFLCHGLGYKMANCPNQPGNHKDMVDRLTYILRQRNLEIADLKSKVVKDEKPAQATAGPSVPEKKETEEELMRRLGEKYDDIPEPIVPPQPQTTKTGRRYGRIVDNSDSDTDTEEKLKQVMNMMDSTSTGTTLAERVKK